MLPGFLTVTTERFNVNYLCLVEVMQGLGEEVDCVVYEGGLRLNVKNVVKTNQALVNIFYLQC